MQPMSEHVHGDLDRDALERVWNLVMSAIDRRDLSPEIREAHAFLVLAFGPEAVPVLP